ncbi:MAG: hypothetical protein KF797_15085 [Flavobacteriales bacterium]|nr:hypothetical protein [Flavobacteriales bacterium]
MNKERINALFAQFEDARYLHEGVEHWSARTSEHPRIRPLGEFQGGFGARPESLRGQWQQGVGPFS